MSRPKRAAAFLAVAAVAVLVAVALNFQVYMGPTKPNRALHEAAMLVRACRVYQQRPEAGGKYPAALADLLAPPFGGYPLVDMANGLNDPWGNPYRYAVVQNEKRDPLPYVWAEWVVDGELKLIGAKGAAGGTVLFGRPR
jgi:hypothetical protein